MSYVDPFSLPDGLRPVVEAEIELGERIAWLEQPIPRAMARTAWPIVLFAIPWTAFAIFWTVSAA